mgnify:CR=1 FL=1
MSALGSACRSAKRERAWEIAPAGHTKGVVSPQARPSRDRKRPNRSASPAGNASSGSAPSSSAMSDWRARWYCPPASSAWPNRAARPGGQRSAIVSRKVPPSASNPRLLTGCPAASVAARSSSPKSALSSMPGCRRRGERGANPATTRSRNGPARARSQSPARPSGSTRYIVTASLTRSQGAGSLLGRPGGVAVSSKGVMDRSTV